MRCLGLDYGTKRLGLAFADDLGVAVPLPAICEDDPERQVAAVAAVVRERRVDTLVAGWPYNMDGSSGPAAARVGAFLDRLAPLLPPGVRIERCDERLTSAVAGAHLSLRELRRQRAAGTVDSGAACVILRDFLERLLPPLLPPDPEGGEEAGGKAKGRGRR